MHLLQAPRDESSTDLARYKPQDVGPIHHPKPQPAIAAADTAAVKETILARIKVSCMSCRWWFYPKPEMGAHNSRNEEIINKTGFDGMKTHQKGP